MQAPYQLGALIRPNDKELLQLLVAKIHGYDDPRIPVININNFEPWELAQFLGVNSYDREWYCFRYRQEPNSRTTKAGYYKVTGKGSKIKDRQQEEIGTKTFLVYYTGRTPNGVKTSWKMHEITATCLPDHQRSIILCKLIDRSENEGYLSSCNGNGHGYSMAASDSHHMANHSSFDNGETSWSMSPENQVTENGIPQQEGPELAPYPESFHGWTGQSYTSDNLPVPVAAAAEQGLFYDIFGSPMF
ncbi:NAC domain-containing protein 69 [Manihot esculenta]|uniref:NAC domain-containing protein n=1 Tax=Manihot esculenta TaxID=3983 RepID=A0A2C9VA78_MANES|nr:NAC domain-containing protein 69 [Manihot esculenta]XP_043815920.1 NAC domain-containing protein 69 [Manihot esculenta]OAY41730.1 hypothetical protein MANES_09G124900v8 [Manihot esculenta]